MSQNCIIGIVGRKGSGKSTLAAQILQRCGRLFVFDPMGEHTWVPNRLRSIPVSEDFFTWSEVQQAFAGSFIPQGDLADDFAELTAAAYERGNLMFGVEEIPMLVSASFVPPELDRVIRLGRHRQVSLLWTAQRMAEVARRLTAATDFFALFRHTEPRDLDAIAERAGSEVAGKVAELPLHGYLVWDVVAGRETTLEALISSLVVSRAVQMS